MSRIQLIKAELLLLAISAVATFLAWVFTEISP